MALSTQYFNGSNWQQFGITTADITISVGLLATQFYSVKDSEDNCWIWGLNYANDNNKTVLICISKTGIKRRAILNGNSITVKDNGQLIILRNGDLALQCYVSGTSTGLYGVSKDFVGAGEEIVPYSIKPIGDVSKFAIYQDRYIWVARGTTVKIYDYSSKVELASVFSNVGIWDGSITATCDVDNNLYVTNYHYNSAEDQWTRLHKIVFNGANTLSYTNTYLLKNYNANIKQLLIDKWGDLVILTNSGTASTLLKYTTAGVQIGTALNLGGAFYNLNTDRNGNYYYSNVLGTYKITANTAQGQAFTGVGTKIRGSGMTTYGNNCTGYNPAVFGAQ